MEEYMFILFVLYEQQYALLFQYRKLLTKNDRHIKTIWINYMNKNLQD